MQTRRDALRSLGILPFLKSKVLHSGLLEFNVIRHGSSTRRYLHIHGNEVTAREVLTEHMATQSGVAFLANNQQRNFDMGGMEFDPNRVWSHLGASANIRKLNPRISEAGFLYLIEELDQHREKLLKAILPPKNGLLIALHNNGQGYSVQDEVAISDRTSLADAANPHEFFLCTDPQDYQILAGSPFNVVLQNKVPPFDDGSFSRLAANSGVRYVNLEVALGNKPRQVEMLNWAEKNLPI